MKKEVWKKLFLEEIHSFIDKLQKYENVKNSLNCKNCFNNLNSYQEEKLILAKIIDKNYTTTVEQGNTLELLVKSLFEKIDLVHSVKITTKDIAIGQIDIQLVPIDDDMLYEIWGIKKYKPNSIIGECKNYPNSNVGRPEIEKICWRTCKGRCLSFFIGFEYSEPAIDEIAYFNNNKHSICQRCEGAIIVPLTVFMLEEIIVNNINFCYFINWAISTSQIMSINNYIYQFK
jgi:hypothetical protein